MSRMLCSLMYISNAVLPAQQWSSGELEDEGWDMAAHGDIHHRRLCPREEGEGEGTWCRGGRGGDVVQGRKEDTKCLHTCHLN